MLVPSLIGFAVFFGLIAWALRRWAWRWNRLGVSYGRAALPPERARITMRAAVFLGGGPLWTHYFPVTMAVHDDGLSFRLWPPLPFLHQPLFIPFADIKISPAGWYLNADSFAIGMAQGDGMEIVIDDEMLAWIKSNTERL